MLSGKPASSKFLLLSTCILVLSNFVKSFHLGLSLSTATRQRSASLTSCFTSKGSWNEEHLAHGASEIHEETAEELLESEDAAAWDAHDSPDAGMEAAAEERAVMLAAELMHEMKQKAEGSKEDAKAKWSNEHLAHGAAEVHEETASELLESEDAAAWDAHGSPDAGMEAAAEERAVMLAAEMMHKMKQKAEGTKEDAKAKWSNEHLAHSAAEVNEETASELLESEDAAAWDAHDSPDAGMEAAAEERAVMLAAELMHKMKEEKSKKAKK